MPYIIQATQKQQEHAVNFHMFFCTFQLHISKFSALDIYLTAHAPCNSKNQNCDALKPLYTPLTSRPRSFTDSCEQRQIDE